MRRWSKVGATALVLVLISQSFALAEGAPSEPLSAAEIPAGQSVRLDDERAFAEALAESEEVSVSTAQEAIAASPAISALAERLAAVKGFSAIWLDWQPELTITIAAQQQSMSDVHGLVSESETPLAVPIEFQVVAHSEADLIRVQEEILSNLVAASLESVVAIDIDVKANGLVIEVDADDQQAVDLTEELTVSAKVPIAIIVRSQAPIIPAATLAGGGHMSGGSSCTSGFAVRRTTSSSKGLLTAGHCSNSASQAGVTLGSATNDTCPSTPLSGQTADRQFHSIPSPHGATNSVFLGGPPRPARTILSAVANNTFFVGQPMEKYGRASGYRTGTVQNINHSNTTCGGLTQLVRASALTQIGDSGGPVIQQNLALGITQAVSSGNTTAFSRILRSTAGTTYVVCIKANCAP